ncbi:MAG: ABC transporter ATP-binding protein [Bacilli bacterium]|nr:ABC transporter ATP-binding protein [Bacilli bacterium]
MENIIEIEELTFSYHDKLIFSNLNLIIPKGAFFTILGPNGSGKSTLLKLLAGKLNADTFIMIENTPIIKESFELIKDDVSYITSSPKVTNKNTKVKELLTSDSMLKKFVKNLKIDSLLEKPISKLNTENKILVEFIKVIIQKPKIIIIDSALEFLSKNHKQEVVKILKQLNENGTTIINATNNIDDCLLGNYIGIITEKNIMFGPSEIVLDNEELFEHCSLNLPFIIELSHKLQFYSLINNIYVNSEKLVEDLWT